MLVSCYVQFPSPYKLSCCDVFIRRDIATPIVLQMSITRYHSTLRNLNVNWQSHDISCPLCMQNRGHVVTSRPCHCRVTPRHHVMSLCHVTIRHVYLLVYVTHLLNCPSWHFNVYIFTYFLALLPTGLMRRNVSRKPT